MIFVGDDWAKAHHDVVLMDAQGGILRQRRLPEGVDGLGQLQALVAAHAADPAQVAVGIETDRGLWVQGLVAAGYQVFAVNPKVAARYRDRQAVAGAKSDRGDAKMLADLVRTDRHQFRVLVPDSVGSQAVQVLARTQQRLLESRQGEVNALAALLRDFYPGALVAFDTDLVHPDALAVLAAAPTPAEGRQLSPAALAALLRQGGRQRGTTARAAAIRTALQRPQLEAPAAVAAANGAAVRAAVAVLRAMSQQLAQLTAQEGEAFARHPDAEWLTSLPGLGPILGARVLGEFGDAPARYQDARARKNYAGTAPITRASGTRRAVRARYVRNRHLADACHQWAFCSLKASPGARAFYAAQRARGRHHHAALRALSNRWVGILHGCLAHRTAYDEARAWGHRTPPIDTPRAA